MRVARVLRLSRERGACGHTRTGMSTVGSTLDESRTPSTIHLYARTRTHLSPRVEYIMVCFSVYISLGSKGAGSRALQSKLCRRGHARMLSVVLFDGIAFLNAGLRGGGTPDTCALLLERVRAWSVAARSYALMVQGGGSVHHKGDAVIGLCDWSRHCLETPRQSFPLGMSAIFPSTPWRPE